MRGTLAEFTLTHLLQLFGVAERTGAIAVETGGARLTLLVEVGRVSGLGLDGFDVRESLLRCELLSSTSHASLMGITPRADTPGLSLLARNAVEPARWEAFVERMLEQHVYPLLNHEQGEFEVNVGRCPPAPLRFSISIQQLILDGTRWEAEIEALGVEGYPAASVWRRAAPSDDHDGRLTGAQWLVWALAQAPTSIAEMGRRLCLSNLSTAVAVKRLYALGLFEREPS